MFKSNELIVISGGTGWIGRSIVEQITESNLCKPEQIILISSTDKTIEISKKNFKSFSWENLKINSQVTLYFDLAFQTQDKLNSLGESKYVEQNETIIEKDLLKSYLENVKDVTTNDNQYITRDSIYLKQRWKTSQINKQLPNDL